LVASRRGLHRAITRASRRPHPPRMNRSHVGPRVPRASWSRAIMPDDRRAGHRSSLQPRALLCPSDSARTAF
jgi:hypothetical protein